MARCAAWRDPSSIMNIIEKAIDDPELIVSNLSKCDCCKTHMCLRPYHLYDRTWLENSLGVSRPVEFDIEFDNKCKCICRHSSRLLCRTFNPYFQ